MQRVDLSARYVMRACVRVCVCVCVCVAWYGRLLVGR